jgi:hypothetical protein
LVWWFKLQTPACHHLKKIKCSQSRIKSNHTLHQSNAPSQEFIKSLFFINLKETDCSRFHHTQRERVYNSKQIRLRTSSKIPC